MDRNGNAPPGNRSNMYAQLAWGLSQRGVASLRFDKRTSESATVDELAGDAAAAARLLVADGRFGPVLLVGHSEGAWVALRSAGSGAPVTGVAMLAGSGRPYVDGIAAQVAREIDSAAARRFREIYPRYLAGDSVGEAPEEIRPLLAPGARLSARSLAAFDPATEARGVRVPLLVVQGAVDPHVSVDDAQRLKDARPDASMAILPRTDHFFKAVTSEDPVARLARYLDPTVPLVPELVDAIDGWIDGLIRP
jgi:pimeloyl-ACP methyl ester carboxylesterase